MGKLTYIVRSPDWVAMLWRLPVYSLPGAPVPLPPPPGTWAFPQILFDEFFYEMIGSVAWDRLEEQTRNDFWATLRFALISLPAEEANQIQHDGMTVLIAMAK